MSEAALPRTAPHGAPHLGALTLAALGIVYGDIGTSPLYAFKQAADAGGALSPETILGIVSLIFWALIVIVSLKYAILIMRADNRGEGGIVALLALLDVRHAPAGSWRASLLIVGLIGAALLYGDGVITPAISVLSAVEGLKLDAPAARAGGRADHASRSWSACSWCSAREPRSSATIFGPVMLVWFVAIGVLGLRGIMRAPAILAALSPHHALTYLLHAGPGISFAVLGAAFLAVTGGEAMYADMGHFGRLPDPPRLVRRRPARSGAQLFRPGRAAAGRPRTPSRTRSICSRRVGALPDGGVRDGRHHHRLAGHHLRRVLADPAGDPARLPAAHARAAYGQPREGADLHADGELAARGRHARRGDHLRLLRRARRRLRHRRLDADGDHHGAGRAGRAAMGLQPARGRRRQRLLPRRRPDLRRRQRDKLFEGGWFPLLLAASSRS